MISFPKISSFPNFGMTALILAVNFILILGKLSSLSFLGIEMLIVWVHSHPYP
jgi:hypothetical protein